MYKILYNKDMKVGVFCNSSTKKFEEIRRKLFAELENRGIVYSVYYSVEEIGEIDVLIVLGGDGTILKAAGVAGMRGIRILGINSGNLGFLTQFEGGQVREAIDLLCSEYETERRSILQVDVGGRVFYALKDAVFAGLDEQGADNNVVAISVEIDGKKVDNFVGDGIIVSTPTGSTAYSLSAGGSILTPDIAAFCLTPVCAHSLHNRPIVYADSSVLRVLVRGGEPALFLFCDGAVVATVGKEQSVLLRKAPFEVEFIRRKDSNFFDKLLFKLTKWSE